MLYILKIFSVLNFLKTVENGKYFVNIQHTSFTYIYMGGFGSVRISSHSGTHESLGLFCVSQLGLSSKKIQNSGL